MHNTAYISTVASSFWVIPTFCRPAWMAFDTSIETVFTENRVNATKEETIVYLYELQFLGQSWPC